MSGQISIVPKNPQTMATMQAILSAPADQPIVEMNDETARDMDVIRRSLADLGTRWRGRMDCRIPTMPSDRKEYWGVVANTWKGQHLLLPVLKDFLDLPRSGPKVVIDLGCGESAATTLLLSKGWKVIAVDSSYSANAVLFSQHPFEFESDQLSTVEADATEYAPEEPVDLVVASDLFPYIDPAQFLTTWKRVHDVFLKKGGTLIGSLFRTPTLPLDTHELRLINGMKEAGAWFLPDRRMVRPLLTDAGYEVKACKYLKEDFEGEDRATRIQFVAEKKV